VGQKLASWQTEASVQLAFILKDHNLRSAPTIKPRPAGNALSGCRAVRAPIRGYLAELTWPSQNNAAPAPRCVPHRTGSLPVTNTHLAIAVFPDRRVEMRCHFRRQQTQ